MSNEKSSNSAETVGSAAKPFIGVTASFNGVIDPDGVPAPPLTSEEEVRIAALVAEQGIRMVRVKAHFDEEHPPD